MSLYKRAASTATRMLSAYGLSTTLTRVTGSYDPATGTNTQSESVTAVTACKIAAERSFVDGSLIAAGTAVFLVGPELASPPMAGDKLLWQGEPITVMKAGELAPAGVAVLFELQVAAS